MILTGMIFTETHTYTSLTKYQQIETGSFITIKEIGEKRKAERKSEIIPSSPRFQTEIA